jgi:malonyl-CoA O-methyltransferase
MSTRKRNVTAAFSAAATRYDSDAEAQIRAAGLLAERLPDLPASPQVLELGCGTGLLTRLLLERLPAGARLLATDLSPAMVEQARSGLSDPRLDFAVMDAEAPGLAPASFDLIASSLAAQWFEDLPATINRLVGLLRPGGALLLGSLGSGTFAQWRTAHAELGLEAGVADYPSAAELAALHPGMVVESVPFTIAYGDARAFLRALQTIGAATPKPGHRPLSPGSLRRIMTRLGAPCVITWDILILSARPALESLTQE